MFKYADSKFGERRGWKGMYSHREKVIESGRWGDIQILEENDRDKKKKKICHSTILLNKCFQN